MSADMRISLDNHTTAISYRMNITNLLLNMPWDAENLGRSEMKLLD